MRRFEREIQGSLRFWEVDLKGTELVVTTGERGRKPRTRSQKLRTAELAASKLIQAIREMTAAGWVEVGAELPEAGVDDAHAAVLAAPDDPAGYLVLGDQLQAAGDPRGELVAVQAALAGAEREDLRKQERRLLAEHPFARPLEGLETPWELEWYCGYVRRLALRADAFGTETAEVLEELVDTGSLAFLRHLRLDGDAQFDALAHALGRRTWPVLTTLELGSTGQMGRMTRPVGDLLRMAPRLERLTVAADLDALGSLRHPRLVELELRVRRGDSLRELDLTGLPALERVALAVQQPWLADRRSLAEAVDVPLTRLTLEGAACVELLEGFVPRRNRLDRLILGPTPQGPAVTALLHDRRAVLAGLDIELVGVEISDSELGQLDALNIEADLPDVAVPRDRRSVSQRQERVRRFERESRSDGPGPRFWEIVRQGPLLRVRYGRSGTEGTARETPFATAEQAATEYRKRVRKKLAEGWEERA
ncbi:MAG: WGR domain-containing protein [Myxococcota bacterium]